ncbi:protein phosphatase 1 regulatory subunit 7-like isoform X2 [Scyliorhinus canicula]|uniref:protein phosphatase 1 regulatory subunit 7-like isoform X2 n=1 Tax=Scyliorhinus canicula TaxID=7830 RepID=UPI0018F34B6E|nr:protein phosphatase 1 regulatory subunit 7-like isoform X2 [Scyliorhinus canicula]
MAKSKVGEESAAGCQTKVKKLHSTQFARSTCSKAKPSAPVKGDNKDTSEVQFSVEKMDGCRSGNMLDLHGKGIKKIHTFEKLPGIKILDLSCNSIEEIENLDNNAEITELKLYGNNIRKIKNLERLQDLQILQLQFNRITSIRKGLLRLRKLQRLRLDSNQLICVESREFVGLSHLTSLDISHNQLSDINLQELDLSNNRISEVRGLPLLETLTSVTLSGNVLCSTECLGSLCSLQELNLADNQLKSVCSFSEQFPNLEVLNVVNNYIDFRDGLKSLAQCFHLVELNLAGNATDTSAEEQSMNLMEISYLMPQLEHLDGVSLNPSNNEKQNATFMQETTQASASLEGTQKIASCLMDFESQMEDLQKSLAERFSLVKNLMESLPKKLPFKPSHTTLSARLTPVASYGSQPQTSCRSRSRIEEARSFAAQHFEK